MKRLLCSIMIIVFVLSGCSMTDNNEIKKSETQENSHISAVWIFYDELSMIDSNGGTKESFVKKINDMFDNCVSWGINTVFLHVRPFADSFYKSEIFPWTYYLTGEQGKEVDYDPLEICVSLAHEKGLKIHAWINPFRIAFDGDTSKLAQNHPAKAWLDENTSDVVVLDNGIYFSPASLDAQKLVLDGVREIINKYDVDGIHIDDYFYPSTDSIVDETFYKQYTGNGGKLNLSDWRMSVVSAFVSQMYNVVKSESEECIFSISPAGNIQNNYEQQYADVRLWCSASGYADWIIPQLYYDFESKVLTFDEALAQWEEIHTNKDVKMIYGIAAYRVNENEEWSAGSGIINKQLAMIQDSSSACGEAYFSYSSLADEKRSAEFSKPGTD